MVRIKKDLNTKNIDKKTKKEYNRILAIYRRDLDPNYPSIFFLEKYLKEKYENFIDTYNKKLSYKFILSSGLNLTSTQCNDYSFISKYLNKTDLNKLLNGLFTCSRLEYIADTIDHSKHIYYYLPFLFLPIAINDQPVIQAYLNNNLGPFNSSSNEINIIANSLYLIFDKNKTPEKINNIIKEINRVLDLKSVKDYEKCYLNCLKCIITHNYLDFNKNIDFIIKNHRSLGSSSVFTKFSKYFICLPALVLYNLAYFDKDRTDPMPPEPIHPLWDSELWHEIIKDNQKKEYIIDVTKVSSVLKQWMDELPPTIDFKKLIDSK